MYFRMALAVLWALCSDVLQDGTDCFVDILFRCTSGWHWLFCGHYVQMYFRMALAVLWALCSDVLQDGTGCFVDIIFRCTRCGSEVPGMILLQPFLYASERGHLQSTPLSSYALSPTFLELLL